MARPYWAGDLSNAEWSQCAAGPLLLLPLAALRNQRVCLPFMFPPTSLAAAVPSAHRPTETHNGFGPKREGRERESALEVLFLAFEFAIRDKRGRKRPLTKRTEPLTVRCWHVRARQENQMEAAESFNLQGILEAEARQRQHAIVRQTAEPSRSNALTPLIRIETTVAPPLTRSQLIPETIAACSEKNAELDLILHRLYIFLKRADL